MQKVKSAAEKIRHLEVQGATNVALTALKVLVEQIRDSTAPDRKSTLTEIEEARRILFASRETEPFMRNALRYIQWMVTKQDWTKATELREIIQGITDRFIENIEEARKKISEVGSKRILPGTTVLTHCHSSAVSAILKKAKKEGGDFTVICTETRPVYQGRITAKELIEAGISTTMIVDSAVRNFMKSSDLVIVGSDAITSEGNVINKIGTSMVAQAAQEARVPFYVATELLKFDPQTIHGDYETIEERPSNEIWPSAPSELKIRNPAFDVTRRDFIHGIICEEGVISPHSIMEAIRRHYPWILEIL